MFSSSPLAKKYRENIEKESELRGIKDRFFMAVVPEQLQIVDLRPFDD